MERDISIAEMKVKFLKTKVSKILISLLGFLTLVYFSVLLFLFEIGDPVLYSLLIAGEIFHAFQILTFLHTIWDTEYVPQKKDSSFKEPVDVFITVAGEPVDIVEETLKSALKINYPNFKVYILNDGYVTQKENWQSIIALASKYRVQCITRKIPGGAKAGNINNALGETHNPYVAIFDADHVPHKDFLQKTMLYFADPKVAYVQSPQFYKNYNKNYVTRSSWDQQQLFFGPICKGKNRLNSVPMCGTNMVISREALISVGGMADSISEDLLTGLRLHEKGMKSVYVPKVLSEGLAPEDFLSYFKQQFRWARGSLDVIFKHNIIFKRGKLTFAQRIQYLSSVSFFFSGIVVLIDALIPVVFLYTGFVPIHSSTMLLATVFLPYIFLNLYVLELSTNFSFTFSALAFSMAGFNIHVKALWAIFTRKKVGFHVTPKRQVRGNFIGLTIPHILYIALVIAGIGVAYFREGFSASFVTNSAWSFLNVGVFAPYIIAAASGARALQKVKAATPEKIEAGRFKNMVVVLLLMVAVMSLSYFFFSQESLRLDEAQSLWQTSHSTSHILNIIGHDVHVPLYHILLRFWEYLFGNTVAVARFFSLIFFSLSIPLVYTLGRKAYNMKVGIFSAFILAFSPFMNWYGNEIRMYSLFVFFTLINHYFFISTFKKPSRKAWVGYCISAILGVYTHYFFFFLLASQAAFFALYRRTFPANFWKKILGTFAVIAAAFAPWAWFVVSLGTANNTQPILVLPTTINIFNTFSNFLFGFQADFLNTLLVSLWPLTVLLLFFALRSVKFPRSESAYFIITFILPNILAFLVSLTIRPLYLSRYLIFTAPSLYLLIGWVLSNFPKRFSRAAQVALVVVVAVTLGVQITSAKTPVKENYKDATEYIEKYSTPRDVVVLSAPFTVYPFEYYYDGKATVTTLPIWDRSKPGAIPPFIEEELPMQIDKVRGNHENLWLLLSYDQGYQEKLRIYFDTHFERLLRVPFSPDLVLYEYKLRYR